MSFFLAEFRKEKTGIDGIIEVRLKPSGSFAAHEAPTLNEFCERHNARVLGITPGAAGASGTILVCFETLAAAASAESGKAARP